MFWERFLCKSAVFGALATLLLGFAGQEAIAETATYVGEKVCATCHDFQANLFGHTLHAKAFRENPKNDVEKQVCEACHGAGSLHATNPTEHSNMIGFSKGWGTPVAKQTGSCLSCHEGGNRINWDGSIHQTKKLSCSDCHNPMAKFSANGLLKKGSITETCQTCHQQQRAEFKKKSHMPVPEGKMTCADCHNPHGSTNKRLLKADSVNDLCYTCHAEKRGPYLWEHAPVRENCLNCHEPHGSNNDKLLKQSRPGICVSCHNLVGGMGQTFRHPASGTVSTTAAPIQSLGRSCQNCHSQIHGSNSPDGSRFRR